jgi:hypothetical protein
MKTPFFRGVSTYMNLGDRMVFEREKFSRLNESTLLQVSLTFQRQSKVNISDNNLNFHYTGKSSDYQKLYEKEIFELILWRWFDDSLAQTGEVWIGELNI